MNRLLWLLAVVGISLGSFAARSAPAHRWPASAAQPTAFVLPLAHGTEDHGAAGADADEASGGGGSGWRHFVRWVGHFHRPTTALTIATLLGAAVAGLLLRTRGPEWLRAGSRWCVIVGAVSAMITAPLGWAFAVDHGGSRLLEVHRWLGTSAAAGAVAILILSEVSHRRPARVAWRYAFRTVLFLALPLVLATGYFGGAMVYGTHAYSWNPPHGDQTGATTGHSDEKPATRPAGGADVVTVSMTDEDVFKPASITIKAGTKVRWTNASKDEHTVTDDPKVAADAKDVAVPQGAKPFNSGKIKPGGTYEQTFTVPGTYKYVCEPHEEMDMKGTVVVK